MDHLSHITPEAAAILAIQSSVPPRVEPKPTIKFYNTKSNVSLYYGGGIEGAVDFDTQASEVTPVIDEQTARQNVADFSRFINQSRVSRNETWDEYWKHKIELNEKILQIEREAYSESQQLLLEEDFSDEETNRRPRLQQVPIIQANVGAFDLPKPKPVIIPDPRDVINMRRRRGV